MFFKKWLITLTMLLSGLAQANTLDTTGNDQLSNYFWGVITTFLFANYFLDRIIGRFKKFVIGNLFLFSKDRSKPSSFGSSIIIHLKKLNFELFGHALFLGVCYGFFRLKNFTDIDQAVQTAVLALEFAYPAYVIFKIFLVEDRCPHCHSLYSRKEIGREFFEENTRLTTNKNGEPMQITEGTENIDYECRSCGFNWSESFEDERYKRIFK